MGKYAKQEVYFIGIYENPNPNIRTTSATKFNIIKSKICDLLEDSYKLVDEYINEIKSKYDPSILLYTRIIQLMDMHLH